MLKYPTGWREPQRIMALTGMRNVELAALTGYSKMYVGELLSGKKPVTTQAVAAFARVLGVYTWQIEPGNVPEDELVAQCERLHGVREEERAA